MGVVCEVGRGGIIVVQTGICGMGSIFVVQMGKYPKYQLRCSEALKSALESAGTLAVRGVLEGAFLGVGRAPSEDLGVGLYAVSPAVAGATSEDAASIPHAPPVSAVDGGDREGMRERLAEQVARLVAERRAREGVPGILKQYMKR